MGFIFTKPPVLTSFFHFPVETCFDCLKSNTVLSTSCRDSVWTVSMATVHDGPCWCPTSWGEVINMCSPSGRRQVEATGIVHPECAAAYTNNLCVHAADACSRRLPTPGRQRGMGCRGATGATPGCCAVFFFKNTICPLKALNWT